MSQGFAPTSDLVDRAQVYGRPPPSLLLSLLVSLLYTPMIRESWVGCVRPSARCRAGSASLIRQRLGNPQKLASRRIPSRADCGEARAESRETAAGLSESGLVGVRVRKQGAETLHSTYGFARVLHGLDPRVVRGSESCEGLPGAAGSQISTFALQRLWSRWLQRLLPHHSRPSQARMAFHSR